MKNSRFINMAKVEFENLIFKTPFVAKKFFGPK